MPEAVNDNLELSSQFCSFGSISDSAFLGCFRCLPELLLLDKEHDPFLHTCLNSRSKHLELHGLQSESREPTWLVLSLSLFMLYARGH
jgi:hypothetical protein